RSACCGKKTRRRSSVSQFEHPIAPSVATDGRGNPVACHVPPQHVGPMTAGPRPLANGAIFRVAAKADVLRSGTSLGWNALAKACVIETLESGKSLRMAIRGTRQRATRRERRSAVLSAE